MKLGIYYHKESLILVEPAWITESNSMVTVWTYHDLKTGQGFLTDIPIAAFKKNFKYLGAI